MSHDPHAPVVFLDIDGVCNHAKVYAAMSLRAGKTEPHDWLDPECVARINTLCSRTGAVIVISSSWRVYLQTHTRVAEVLGQKGLTTPVIGQTPQILDMVDYGDGTRWVEIEAWLKGHPEVTRWVILDDCDWPRFPPERFVRTDIAVGITDADMERAVAILTAT